ncbi:MAG: translation initiation factor IF-2 subunit gamma [Candidatus Thermoplasmatota archaeon]|nr:translation initiation factor IF-2 subunit gamma [Candidatus Thermoplasmatota archaeon]
MKLPQQPEINVGMIGHVDHGKTTLTQAVTGRWTDTHSEELKRGISIRLGYADAAFYKCPNEPAPACYTNKPKCPSGDAELLRTLSIVDAPGHETLMATMLSGAAIMDGAVLMVAVNEECPQPQTKEHLMAIDIVGLENVIVVQNKIDLVTEERARESYNEIRSFLEGTVAEDAPIIPVSAQQEVNVDAVIEAIEEQIPTPDRDPDAPSRMFVARSFDVNKPGTGPKDLKGGIIGGSLIQGSIEIGDEIELSPGREVEEHGKTRREPIVSEVTSLIAGNDTYDKVGPGGLIGVATNLDPSLTKSDALTGRMLGKPGTLPPLRHEFTMDTHLLERVVGSAEDLQVDPIRTNEPLMLNIGTATTVGVVTSARKEDAEVRLKLPVCAEDGQRVAISRRVGTRWRLIGHGVVQ